MKRKVAGVIPLAFFALLMLLPDTSSAYRRHHFRHLMHGYIGGQLTGYVIAAQVTDQEYLGHGGGGGLFGGVRIGPWLSVEGNWGITYHNVVDDYYEYLDAAYIMTFTVDGKLHIPSRGIFEPFIQAGVGYAFMGSTYEGSYTGDAVFASGPIFNVGGGVDMYFGPWLSLGGRILYRGLYYSDPNYQGKETFANFINGVTIDANVTFHF